VDELTVEIGGLRSSIVTRHSEIADVIAHRYRGFLTSAPPDWRIEAGVRADGLVALEDVVVRRAGGPRRLQIERHDFLATLDLDGCTGTLELGAIDHIALDTFLRVTYSLALLPLGALLVHAASLGRAGRAWMFPGPSGSGKTTLTRLSADADLLSDEISIVRVDADGSRCYGSPFWGDLGRPGDNHAVPLAAIHFLRHAERHVAAPLAARRALAGLLPNVLFFASEPDLVARVLEITAALTAAVPCFTLGFRPESSVWEVIAAA
jgi:hypothetical protein